VSACCLFWVLQGCEDFKIGEMLKMARKETGMTQEEIAKAMHTKKSAISRIENHAQDIRLSTPQAFARILGKEAFTIETRRPNRASVLSRCISVC
jgi:transcriptional regulator with XRE-family HTH domain